MAELKQAIALSARLIHNEELSNTESQGILSIPISEAGQRRIIF